MARVSMSRERLGTYRVVVSDVVLLEERNGNITPPCRRVTRATEEHYKHKLQVALHRARLLLKWVMRRLSWYLSKPPRLPQAGHPSVGKHNEYRKVLRGWEASFHFILFVSQFESILVGCGNSVVINTIVLVLVLILVHENVIIVLVLIHENNIDLARKQN